MNTPEIHNCRRCWQEFKWTGVNRHDYPPSYCEPCAVKKIEEAHKAACEKMATILADITPKRFQSTDTGHPDFNVPLWQKVAPWRPSDDTPWLGLIGPTGTSKTRCAFMLLRDIALGMIQPASNPDSMPWRPSIAALSAYRIGEVVMAQFNDGTKQDAQEALRRYRHADVLLLDDLGKQRNTPALSTELFALLDHRHAENLVTIWSANSTPETIVGGMTEDMAAPLAGRIRECSKIIIIE